MNIPGKRPIPGHPALAPFRKYNSLVYLMKLAYLINVYVATRLMVYAVRNVISISLVRTASDGKLGEGLGTRLIFNDIKH